MIARRLGESAVEPGFVGARYSARAFLWVVGAAPGSSLPFSDSLQYHGTSFAMLDQCDHISSPCHTPSIYWMKFVDMISAFRRT